MSVQEAEPNVFSIRHDLGKREVFRNNFGSKARHKWGERYPSLEEEDIRGVLLETLPLLVGAKVLSNFSPLIDGRLRTRQRQLNDNNRQASLPAPVAPAQENSLASTNHRLRVSIVFQRIKNLFTRR